MTTIKTCILIFSVLGPHSLALMSIFLVTQLSLASKNTVQTLGLGRKGTFLLPQSSHHEMHPFLAPHSTAEAQLYLLVKLYLVGAQIKEGKLPTEKKKKGNFQLLLKVSSFSSHVPKLTWGSLPACLHKAASVPTCCQLSALAHLIVGGSIPCLRTYSKSPPPGSGSKRLCFSLTLR